VEIFDLTGKVALVTGGNRGIGFSISRGLAKAGATSIIVNRRAEEGQKAAEALTNEGLKAASIPTDITSIPAVVQMTEKAINDFGKIDILVNCAGVVVRKMPEEITEDDWDYVMNLNLKAVFFCCQSIGKEMIKNGMGRIINISSNVSYRLLPVRSIYSASKAGLNHLTRALAFDWAKYNINVNAIAPNVTITDMNRKYFLEDHPEALEAHLKLTPKNRVAYPDDYVGAAVFLASDAADYITGQVIFVDGGVTL